MLNIYKWIHWSKYRGVLNIEYVRTLYGILTSYCMLNIYKWIHWSKYRGVLNIEYVRTLLGETVC